METEGTDLEAAALEDGEVGLSTTVVGEGAPATEGLSVLFFFYPFSTVEGGGIVVGEVGEGSSEWAEGSLTQFGPRRKALRIQHAFFLEEQEKRRSRFQNPKNLPKTLNHSKNRG